MTSRILSRATRALALVAGLSAGAVACGGSATAESPFDRSPSEDESIIVVDNRNSSISEMTIWLEPLSGVRTRLGTVTLSERESFVVRDLSWGDRFRLVGDPVGTGRLTSRIFSLTRATVVEWDVAINEVRFGGSGGG